MREPTAIEVAQEFWRLMGTNDFHSVGAVLSSEFVLEWPQTKERIRGAERFARMNMEYPANGPWRFTVNRLVGGESEAVSDVTVTDGRELTELSPSSRSPKAKLLAWSSFGRSRLRLPRIAGISQSPWNEHFRPDG